MKPFHNPRPWDKCGNPVPPHDDAVNLEILLAPSALLVGARPRHLLPNAYCEGSPSRAQYLEGQPRDTRGYPYVAAAESQVRAAYATLLDTFPEENNHD